LVELTSLGGGEDFPPWPNLETVCLHPPSVEGPGAEQAMITAVGVTVSGQQLLGRLVAVCCVLRSLDGQHRWCQVISVHLGDLLSSTTAQLHLCTQDYASGMHYSYLDSIDVSRRRLVSRHMVQGTIAIDFPVAVITLWTAPSPIHTCV